MNANIQRILRRMALAERWDDVRSCLSDYIEENPQDLEAKEELYRLNHGEPMRLTLSAAERREAAAHDARKALDWLMDDHPEEKLRMMSKDELSNSLSAFEHHAAILKRCGVELSEQYIRYLRLLKKRIRELGGRKRKRILLQGGLVASALTLVVSVCVALNNNAQSRYEQLMQAMEHPSVDNVETALHSADSALYRYFCPELENAGANAQNWLRGVAKHYHKIDSLLSHFESGKKKVSDLSPSALAELEAEIDASHRGREQLRSRWHDVCRLQYNELVAHKTEIQHELEKPLPVSPELTGNAGEDIKLLTAHKEALLKRLAETDATIRLYGISSDMPASINEALDDNRMLLRDIKQLQQFFTRISACRSYKSYRKILEETDFAVYAPAQRLLTIKAHLPSEEEMMVHVSAPEGDISAEQLSAATAVFLNGASSFTQQLPASPEVLQIAEDLFTAPSYRHKVYTLKVSDSVTWYSTIQPQLDKTNFITYRRSTIDPAYTPEDTYREFQNDDTYELGEIDASTLPIDLDIERNTLFIQKNIPDLLTKVLNYPEGKHPALAQAYIYWVLLKLTNAHPHPLLSGVRFSPTLKAHSASFAELLKRHRLNLVPGCWLSTAADVRRAETAFAEWFKTHRGHDYRAEMADNFLAAYAATARFCGYVNAAGKMHLCRERKDGEPLWYVSADGVRYFTEDEAPSDALPLSPLFAAERKNP